MLLAFVVTTLFNQGVIELRRDVLLDLGQVIDVPGVLQGPIVVARPIEELLQIEASGQIEGDIAKAAG